MPPRIHSADRIVIPARVNRSKVPWKKRHLEHLSYVLPTTPDLQAILNDIYSVAPRYGDSETWLFPSLTSASGHMEEEKNAALWLRRHSGVSFTMHQLRHNFASAGENCGYSTVEFGELLNQSRSNVTQRYIDERLKRHQAMMIAIAAEIKRSIEEERLKSVIPQRSDDGVRPMPQVIATEHGADFCKLIKSVK